MSCLFLAAVAISEYFYLLSTTKKAETQVTGVHSTNMVVEETEIKTFSNKKQNTDISTSPIQPTSYTTTTELEKNTSSRSSSQDTTPSADGNEPIKSENATANDNEEVSISPQTTFTPTSINTSTPTQTQEEIAIVQCDGAHVEPCTNEVPNNSTGSTVVIVTSGNGAGGNQNEVVVGGDVTLETGEASPTP